MKLIAIILSALLLTQNTNAAFPADPDYPGPYMCVHQDVITSSTKFSTPVKTYIYGTVNSAFERCPIFNIHNPSNTPVTNFELNQVFWQDPNSTDPDVVIEFVNKLLLTEDPHDPSCQFGIIF